MKKKLAQPTKGVLQLKICSSVWLQLILILVLKIGSNNFRNTLKIKTYASFSLFLILRNTEMHQILCASKISYLVQPLAETLHLPSKVGSLALRLSASLPFGLELLLHLLNAALQLLQRDFETSWTE